VNGIFGGDSLTITTKFGVTSAEVPLKFAQIIDLKNWIDVLFKLADFKVLSHPLWL